MLIWIGCVTLSLQLALDDCVALSHVMCCTAERVGVSLVELHRLFAVALDETASYVQVYALLENQ